MIENIIADIVDQYAPQDKLPEDWDTEGLEAALHAMFSCEFDLEGGEEDATLPLPDLLMKQAIEEYARREASIAEDLKRQMEERSDDMASIIDPKKLARKRLHDLELSELLRTIDEKWINHLYEMDYLRESVRLRAFGQKDPLLEYKEEGFELFQNLIRSIEENVIQMLFRLTDPARRHKAQPATTRRTITQEQMRERMREYNYSGANKESDRSFAAQDGSQFALGGKAGGGSASNEPAKRQPVRVVDKTKPNDPCPCGSGKKFKKCCGRLND